MEEKDTKHIETFFDYNPTPKEIYGMTGFEDATKEEYISVSREITKTEKRFINFCNADLYRFFYYRGERERAMTYADKIPDSDWKWFTLLNHDH